MVWKPNKKYLGVAFRQSVGTRLERLGPFVNGRHKMCQRAARKNACTAGDSFFQQPELHPHFEKLPPAERAEMVSLRAPSEAVAGSTALVESNSKAGESTEPRFEM
jgi:hypothetical protein